MEVLEFSISHSNSTMLFLKNGSTMLSLKFTMVKTLLISLMLTFGKNLRNYNRKKWKYSLWKG